MARICGGCGLEELARGMCGVSLLSLSAGARRVGHYMLVFAVLVAVWNCIVFLILYC